MGTGVTDANAVPLTSTISDDLGFTWSEPVSMGMYGVDPALVLLDDGRVALSSGRPGVYLRIADQTGTVWSEPFFVWNGSGDSYTAIARHPDGDVLVAYAESSFHFRGVPTG